MRFLSCLFAFILFLLPGLSFAQMVSLDPPTAGAGEIASIVFDASQGNKELINENKIYVHHGVVTDKVDGTAWKYVKGNWGKDDGIGLMTRVEGQPNKWRFTFSPNIRSYFGVPASENIFRISCVFRNADGSKKGTMPPGQYGWGTVTSNQDIYINLNSGDYVQINQPLGEFGLFTVGQALTISATASSDVTKMEIWLDEGAGYVSKTMVSGGKNISYSYSISQSVVLGIKITAKINGFDVSSEKVFDAVIRNPNVIETRPIGTKQGVTYFSDPTKVRLSLLAPNKSFVYVVGDMNNWKVAESFQMKQDGEYFWLDIENLIPGKPYVYQYWIDGQLFIADPYTEQVADPWNDKWIQASIFPSLPAYTREDLGLASVFQTNQQDYTWSAVESNWKKPDVNHLVIYELHVRDFLGSHSYKDLIDTISYLKRLGINAIELMPVSEFEGNDSWGYNPSFYFAVDKYYGTKNDLKRFIDVAHQNGMAVIMDIVLNHAFGQCPLVQMYFDKSANKPSANNPWFYREYVGPYQWGYDFNHDSPYTRQFIDDVNQFWLREFHFDGFRFDFTKGFTSASHPFDGYNASRIAILKRMADKIRVQDPTAYIILEHWGVYEEEQQLAGYGMKLWANRSYDYVPATVGNPGTGSFINGWDMRYVNFFSSHDERRLAEHCLTEGRSQGGYNIKMNEIMYERVKMAAAFTYLQPGPKMIWQFDELGYDIDINFNGRTGSKPLPWGEGQLGYYSDTLRQHIYTTYKALLELRNKITPQKLATATTNHKHSGTIRKLSYAANDFNLLVFGNFGLMNENTAPYFPKTGKWYHYVTGDSIIITNVNQLFTLKPGEWHIYTTHKYGSGFPGAVEIFDNPVTVTPFPFYLDQEITLTFDAKKASKKGSLGLVDAQKVYIHSGTLFSQTNTSQWGKTVGTLTDDSLGLMVHKGNDIWEIKFIPRNYYDLPADQDVTFLAMYFRNENNTRFGYGFRNNIITVPVASAKPIVTVDPPAFQPSTPITITFHADRGSQELINASKIYMHSGLSLVNDLNPHINGWKKVVGNWGMDDGVGRMTKVAGTNKWEVKLTPKTYYNMAENEFPYWITAVFRNHDGSIKGTGPVGNMSNGFIDNKLDYFIRNAYTVSTNEPDIDALALYPNPATDHILLKGWNEPRWKVSIINAKGELVFESWQNAEEAIDVSCFSPGMYFIKCETVTKFKTVPFIKL